MKNEIKAYLIFAVAVLVIHFLVYKSEGKALGLMGFLPAVSLLTINRKEGNESISKAFRLKKDKTLSNISCLLFVAAGITAIFKVDDIEILVNAISDGWVLTLMCLGYLVTGISIVSRNRKSEPGEVVNASSAVGLPESHLHD